MGSSGLKEKDFGATMKRECYFAEFHNQTDQISCEATFEHLWLENHLDSLLRRMRSRSELRKKNYSSSSAIAENSTLVTADNRAGISNS